MPIGINADAVRKEMEESRKQREEPIGDKRICTCGHPVTRHHIVNAKLKCRPAAVKCACTGVVPALSAQDIRLFIFKTDGAAEKHALLKGIVRAMDKGHTLEQTLGDTCMLCGMEAETVPVGLGGSPTRFWVMRTNPELTLLLCAKCREGVESGNVVSA